MALTPSAAWTEAFRRSPNSPRYLVEINDGTNIWRATNGITSLTDVADGAVQRVAPLTASIDPISRKPQVGSINVVVDDAWLRPRWVANRFKGKEITVKLGAEGIAEGDYLSYFRGVIEDIIPESTGNSIEIECLDAGTLMMRKKIVGFWLNQHPLETMVDIFAKAGVPASLIDSASFLPASHLSISHLVVQRGGPSGTYYADFILRDPTPAWTLIRELLELLNGQLVTNEDGKLSFVLFDPLTPALAAWDEDTIEELEQLDTGNVINRFHMTFKRNSNGEYVQEFQLDDTDSQADHAFPGETERIYDHKFRTDWLDGSIATLEADLTDIGTSISLGNSINLPGFSGSRDASPSAGQPADAKVTGTRPAWLRIDDEIVRVTAISFDDNIRSFQNIADPENPGTFVTEGPFVVRATFTIVRGQFGTTAVAHPNFSTVVEITIPVFMGEPRIRRFGDGADRVRVVTPLHEFAIQYGDLVTLDWPRYVNFGKDGITPADGLWEVVSKRTEVETQPPRITWELVFAREVVSSLLGVALAINTNNLSGQTADATQENTGFQAYALNPGSVTVIDDLEVAVCEVEVSNGTSSQSIEEVNVEVPANSDTYIAVSTETGTLTSDSVPNGDPAPTTEPASVVVAIVETDASTVTDIKEPTSDEQPTAPVAQANVDTNEDTTSSVPNSFFNKFQASSEPET